MKKFLVYTTLTTFLIGTILFGAVGRIQNEDIKSAAELVAAGSNATHLPHDDKVWITSYAKNISQAIVDEDLIGKSTTNTLTNKTISGSSNTISNIADGSLATSYVKADGSRPLTANWSAGNFSITANAVNVGSDSGKISGLSTINNGGDLTVPNAVDTFALLAASQALTNKTINASSNTISNIADANLTGQILGPHGGTGFNNSGTLDFGSFALKITTTANTNVQAPTAGILATLNGTETLTNKSLDANTNTISNLSNGNITVSANIARSKLAAGTASHVVINDGSGNFSSEAQLAGTRGGTGVSNSGLFTYGSNNLTITTTAQSAVTFPTAGTLATLHGVETFDKKTFSDAIIGTQIATPSSPAASNDALYFKSDDKLYRKTSGGTETLVGPSSGAANAVLSPNSTGTYAASAVITNNGTASVLRQDGSWISNATRNGTGDVTLTFSGFSVAPVCVCSPDAAGSSNVYCHTNTNTAESTTTRRFSVANDTGGNEDQNFSVICIGPP